MIFSHVYLEETLYDNNIFKRLLLNLYSLEGPKNIHFILKRVLQDPAGFEPKTVQSWGERAAIWATVLFWHKNIYESFFYFFF